MGDKVYKLSRLRRKEWREWHEWAAPLLPNVLEVLAASIEKYPAELQRVMASQAVELANEPIERRTASLVETMSGWAKLIEILLREHQPGITDDEAWDVAAEMQSQMWDILAKAQGKSEGKVEGEAAASPVGHESTDTSPKNTD